MEIYKDERFSDHAPLTIDYDYDIVSKVAGLEHCPRRWQEILFNRKMVTCIFLGFTSGMPLYVLIQLVPAWLRSHEVDLATIGLFALVSLPYTWKFLWSPLMDRYKLPFLGQAAGMGPDHADRIAFFDRGTGPV